MNIGQLLGRGYQILKRQDIESYKLDCELLLAHVLKKDRLFIIINRKLEVNCDIESRYFDLVYRREKREPVKYILGKCEFMGINFNIREGVLIPRPDTEVLVETAIGIIKKNSYKKIYDVCCGSGAIGLSIAKFVPDLYVHLSDISDTACSLTQENAKLLSLEKRTKVFKSDLLDLPINLNEKFDFIASNPPYIRKKDIPYLMDDVKNYEPHSALCGGEDGLDFYRKISKDSKDILNNGGALIFEIGYDQSYDVQNILKLNGFNNMKCFKDLSGNDRVVVGYYCKP